MPWQETEPMLERRKFITEYLAGLYTMSELCARYGISRKSGYKWLARYDEEGSHGLCDRPRIARTCPHRLEEKVAAAILEARRLHPHWGPRKLLDWLHPRQCPATISPVH